MPGATGSVAMPAHGEETTESTTACGTRVEWEDDSTRVESTSVSDDHAEVTTAKLVGVECVEDTEGAACNVPPVPTSGMGKGACSSVKEEEVTEHECHDLLQPAGIDNQVHLSVSIGVVMECEKKAALLDSMLEGGSDPIVAAPTYAARAEDGTDAGNNKGASVAERGDSDGDGDDNWSNASINPSLSTKKEVTCTPIVCVVM